MERAWTLGKMGQGEALLGITLGPQMLPGCPWFPRVEVQIPCTPTSSSHGRPSAPMSPPICNLTPDEGGYFPCQTGGIEKLANETQFQFHRWENKGSDRQRSLNLADGSVCPSQ